MEQDTVMEVETNKQFLCRVAIPQQTSTYKPVAHKTLMDITLEAIETCGFQLEKEIYTYSKEGQRANGKYLLKYGNDSEMSLMIAWQNSYDKSLSLKFAIGTWVFICENGCVSGNIGAFKSKHVGDVQEVTPQTIKEYICGAGDTFYKMLDDRDAMKEYKELCQLCKDIGEIEVLVMGTDTRWVSCPECQEENDPWGNQDTMIPYNKQGEINSDR